ncbi:MAG: TPR domain protein [Microgenomates group bacterium GW2011_GWC1_44_37]|uniref:TPR domain protein n=1 Tax=Candidatus Collierbacteria bacterium GW2011_GWB2_44_22 TaxID=1618387 RepID=A0A0G1KUR0_9BACT|nr:MAG: TPR domain protein [Candidatus Collierbacteria bacterium GW2011_GWA2_44_13]KKT51614.1 MAG: TPR domain protein [Candidatus Collierbacteria bacterium GW2011_GWB2_44_22]KKT63065.1 MAG: TPR domain protein [Candidatus Collierbacteria bacterium GW2011_GWD1_44_27]KKT66420.1 MAG: TPR domain protein [Candidatus Collierbacteria bacterium GW2011_GWC2_44_30]KKT68950.1 MAG: TPR domain protein [Microgenomates group bacterium GW2011_GWC1_44_37]KKT89557.1 MAG: TPR domain protein [Candidatus Collierbac
MPIDFDETFKKALDILENSSENVFLTGNAGTGKSTLLDHFRNHTTKNVAVVAPTGVAALNVHGETIHSFFGFPPNVTPERAVLEAKHSKKVKIYNALDILIVDEISMVRADLLDSIDSFLKSVRKKNLSFGGVRIIMVGDLHQLPPVVTHLEKDALLALYETPYFFSSKVFKSLFQGLYSQLRYIELQTIYRQSEKKFIEILNRIRNNITTDEDLIEINNQIICEGDCIDSYIILTALNDQADKINQVRLDEIEGPLYSFHATRTGDFSLQQAPAADMVTLKTGARVMLLNNDVQDRWINGTVGTLFKAESNCVYVKIDGGEVEKIEPFTWTSYKTSFNQENSSLETKEIGSFKQLPIRLAWAITIHKSQGKTFEKVVVDLGRGAFAHGQTYVALSRCTTLSGLRLVRPLDRQSIIMDRRVLDFLTSLRLLVGQL